MVKKRPGPKSKTMFRRVSIADPVTPKKRKGGVHWQETPVTKRLKRVLAEDSQPDGIVATTTRVVGGYVAGAAAAGAATVAAGPEVSAPAILYGGLAGAIAGYNSRKQLVQNKMKSVANLQVGKTSMTKKGKAKVKRVKSVAVSPYLRKAVKEVMKGAQATGVYKRTIAGVVGNSRSVSSQSSTVGGDVSVATNMMGILTGTQTGAYVAAAYARSTGQRTWWNMLGVKETAADQNFSLLDNSDMNFFTPQKIWHAASVLFNDKAEDPNPYNTTVGNLFTEYNPTSGAEVATAKNLKIEVVESYVQFTMKNLSARPQFVDIYECVSTMKFSDNNPLDDLREVALQIQDRSDTHNIVGGYEIVTAITSDENHSFITDIHTDAPGVCKQNGWKWKYVKKTMMLASGETCVHTMKGPKGILDFAKLLDTEAPGTTARYRLAVLKDWSKHVMISVYPDQVARLGSGSTLWSNAGLRWITQTPGFRHLFGLVAVETTEYIKMKVPEVAGFVQKTVSTGAGQTLNLRKRRYQFTNLTGGLNSEVNDVVTTTEYNPAAVQSSQGFN